MNTIEKIKNQIKKNKIILYMKGSPENPQCGFSAQVVQVLSYFKIKFAYIDVLKNPDIRKELPIFSNWPTFPQLWIKEELVGGCNIVTEMFHNGELQKLINSIEKEN